MFGFEGIEFIKCCAKTVFEKGRRVCAARAALWSIVDGWLGVSGGIPRTPAMSSGR